MKKFASIILSLAMILSLTACDNKDDAYHSGVSGAISDLASDNSNGGESENSGNSEDNGESNSNTLSNPVKKTPEGDIDMEAALAYETDFEALAKEFAEREVDVSQPVSLNARNNPKTMEVWNYLKECYGTKIISAQQQDNVNQIYEDKVYYNAVEDLAAIKGYDFIHATGDTPNRAYVDAALEWGTESGGLVTFCWHWNVPRDADNPDQGRAFYMERDGVKIVNWNARNATVPGTKEYEVAVHDMDQVASYLQELEAAGITVLWRPFHEASGNWFWWGVQDSDKLSVRDGTYDTFQRLWYMMFDRFENYHKLSNLIWVWNGQTKICEVDPNSYDIAGIDVYPNKEDHSPLASSYNALKGYTYEGKMLALSETGCFPDPQQCVDEGIMWLYYMPWCGEFVYEPSAKGGSTPKTDLFGTPHPNPEKLSDELLREYFSNPALVSWKDLPDTFGEKNIPQRINVWLASKGPIE